MIEQSELDWIVQKAGELLADKVNDAPLTDRDIEMAFEIFAEPRLKRLFGEHADEKERKRAVDYIMAELRRYMQRLNSERWSKASE
ncbi:MAG: hypothetical protein QXP65_00475 [Candidatus Hadarchaeales archaeon]